MTKISIYAARDAFRRLFPAATYNPSFEYDFVLDDKTYKCVSTMSKKFFFHKKYVADMQALFEFAEDAKTLLRVWLIPSDMAGSVIDMPGNSTVGKWDRYEIDLWSKK